MADLFIGIGAIIIGILLIIVGVKNMIKEGNDDDESL